MEIRDSKMRFWHLARPKSGRDRATLDFEANEKMGLSYDEMRKAVNRPAGVAAKVLLTSKKITDFYATWFGPQWLIQDRVLKLFQEEGFTGFEVYPLETDVLIRQKRESLCDDVIGVKAKDIEQMEVPKLWEMLVTGWGGVARPESGMRLLDPSGEYSEWTDASLIMDEKQWDGSDFFIVWPIPFNIFVTDRVAKFIRRNKLTGARLVPVEQMEPLSSSSCGPGKLHQWLPEQKARELGEPLGIY